MANTLPTTQVDPDTTDLSGVAEGKAKAESLGHNMTSWHHHDMFHYVYAKCSKCMGLIVISKNGRASGVGSHTQCTGK
jgi:hypothetical protein